MPDSNVIEELASDLVKSVQTELDWDAPSGAWYVPEGERVRDNAIALLEAAKRGALNTILDGSTVIDFLGASWLGIHSKSYDVADALDRELLKQVSGDDV